MSGAADGGTRDATLADSGRRLKRPSALPRLILMTDSVRLPDPGPAIAALPSGSAVILRHYEAADRVGLARRLLAVCRPARVRLLVAGDARLAASAGADGVHLPEWQARRSAGARQRWPAQWLVTAAAHSPAALWRAAACGADAALLSPVFPTASRPGAPVIGPWRFALWCRRSPLPVYALGGLAPATARRLAGCGAAGYAGISGVIGIKGAAKD